MKRRAGVVWGISIGLGVAIAAHVAFWYLPRERPGVPGAVAAGLLRDRNWEHSLWIPYPHQNLARLERRTGNARRWLGLLRGGQSADASPVPSFGPFIVPPAREMVVAERDGGGAIRMVLDVLPLTRILARSAGILARNPWLAGGTVHLGGQRRATVRWQDGYWVLESTPAVRDLGLPAAALDPAATPALALFRSTEPLFRLPAGLYRLVRGEQGIELRLGAGDENLSSLSGVRPAPMAWLFEADEGEDRGPAGIALWSDVSVLAPFPSAASLARGGRAHRLPGEELLRIAGRSPARVRAGEWEIRTYDAEQSDRGARLSAELERMLGERGRQLDLFAGAEVDDLRAASARIAREFHGLPLARLAGFDPGRIADLLGAFEGCGRSRIGSRRQPASVRWIICPGVETVPPN